MKSLLPIASFLFLFATASPAQSVAINNNGTAANGSAILDVSSTTKGLLMPRMTGAQRLAIVTPATGLQVFQTNDILNNPSGFYFFNGNAWILSSNLLGTNNTTGWALDGNTNTNPATHYLGTSNTVDLRLATNNTTRMTIKSTGEVGIGTASPGSILGITRGSIPTSQPILRIDDGSTSTMSPTMLLFNLGNNTLIDGGTLGTGTMMRLNRDGAGGAGEGLRINNNGTGAALRAETTTGTGVAGQFKSTGGTGLKIDAIKGMQINTTGDGDGLRIDMSSNTNTGAIHGIQVNLTMTGTSSGTQITGISSSPRGNVSSQSIIGVNSIPSGPAGSFIRCFIGDGDMTVNGSIFNSSDRKLKKNIEPMKNMIEQIMKLSPSNYLYRTDEFKMNLPTTRQHGLIAQELQAVFPELVSDEKIPAVLDEQQKIIKEEVQYLGVNYTGLIPIVISGIQEQEHRIEALEKENVQLKKDIATIKAKLNL